jgi:hypothetical protein
MSRLLQKQLTKGVQVSEIPSHRQQDNSRKCTWLVYNVLLARRNGQQYYARLAIGQPDDNPSGVLLSDKGDFTVDLSQLLTSY